MCMTCSEAIERGGTLINPFLCGAPVTRATKHRIETDISHHQFFDGRAAVVGLYAGLGLAPGQLRAQTPVFLANLRFFDGTTLLREEGAWWSIQRFFRYEDSKPRSNSIQHQTAEEVARGTVGAFEMGRSEGINMAVGTDILLNPGGSQGQDRQLAKLARFMSPLEALAMATGKAGDLPALSGPRDPHEGRLGVIAEGAHADTLVWDGDPETDLGFLNDTTSNLRPVRKDGRIVKETL